MADRRYHVVLNPNSGGALALGLTGASLQERFDAAGQEALVDAADDEPFASRIEAALRSDADIIVAAGGDGTITALADAIIDNGGHKTLAMLPTGTANLLARDLKIPLELDKAIAGLATMETRQIDVGEVNGRAFLHNVTVGLIPQIAAGREQIRGRADPAALIGFLRYFMRRVARSRRLAVEVAVDGGPPRIQRVQALSVSNNAYDQAFGHIFARERLDAGHLCLHTLKHLTVLDIVRLSAAMIMGRWQSEDAIDVCNASEITFRLKKPMVKVMLDGEIENMSVPLQFRVLPKALRVLAPPEKVLPEAETAPDQREFVVGI